MQLPLVDSGWRAFVDFSESNRLDNRQGLVHQQYDAIHWPMHPDQ